MPKIKISVICIGDELLKGFTVNTNLTRIGEMMTAAGLVIDEAAVILDNPERIVKMISKMFENGSDIIITTGGLGPTIDDLTKQTIAEFFETPLIRNKDIVESLKKYWGQRPQPMPESVLSQADIPEGAKWFPNDVGTAPGVLIPAKKIRNISLIQHRDTEDIPCVIMLPGPPAELNPMFKNYVMPFLEAAETEKKFTETIIVSGLPESIVENRTKDLVSGQENISLAYCASPETVKVYLSGTDRDKLKVKKKELEAALHDRLLPEGVTSPAEQIVRLLNDKKLTMATAESCTGGMIAAAITDIPGASAVFKGSIVSYSNEWKEHLLKVPEKILIEYGAVSPECAEEMVKNLCRLYKTDAGISVTGIAGPGGGTAEKPVGLVYVGVKLLEKKVVKQYNFPGNRKTVRRRTVATALNILVDLIKEY